MGLFSLVPLVSFGIAVSQRYTRDPQTGAFYQRRMTREIDDKLFEAISKNDLKRVSQLIAKGANPNARDSMSLTPLACSTESGSSMVKLLLEKGARVNDYMESKGETALHWALKFARKERYQTIQLLLQNKALVNARSASHCVDGVSKFKQVWHW